MVRTPLFFAADAQQPRHRSVRADWGRALTRALAAPLATGENRAQQVLPEHDRTANGPAKLSAAGTAAPGTPYHSPTSHDVRTLLDCRYRVF